MQVADLLFNIDTLKVARAGQRLSLSPICRRILEVLMRASPGVRTRVQLEQASGAVNRCMKRVRGLGTTTATACVTYVLTGGACAWSRSTSWRPRIS